MAWTQNFQNGMVNFNTQMQGPVNVINEESIRIMQEFTFPPPQGYEFIKELGTGGCGKVYLAKEILSGCLIAVKCVKIFNAYTLSMARALRKELLIMKTSPNLHHIKCYGEGQSHTDNTIWYLALEYMEMGSVRHLYSNSSTISEAEVRMCIYQVLLGLKHLHAVCIVHRDIKGDNILRDSKRFYKIGDFGLTKQCYEASNGSFGLMTAGIGTHTHMAPEVMNPTLSKPYDMKADIWSLGCLVLEILSRGTLTVAVVNHQAVYKLPPIIITLQCTHFIQCCLQVNPANRPTSSELLNHNWFKM